MKRLVMALMAFVFLMSVIFVLPACAETVFRDGIEVTLMTDKESYDSMEAINARLAITNANRYAVQNVSSEITVPDGYVLSGKAEEEHGTLQAGQRQTQEAAVYRADYKPNLPKTGDNSHGILWGLLFVMSSAAVCVLVIRHPQGKRIISLLLCVVLVAPCALEVVPAFAEKNDTNIQKESIIVTKRIRVDEKPVDITGIIEYDALVTSYRMSKALVAAPASDFEYTIENGGVTITDYIGDDTEIIIPETIEGYSVIDIGRYAFYACKKLVYVKLSSGIKQIREGAFLECTGLTSIDLSTGITSIGERAFEGCTNLVSIELPLGITRINRRAFYGCSSLSDIELSSKVSSIGEDAFDNCTSLTEINFPSSLTSIETGAFDGAGLHSIDIPTNVTSFGGSVFSNCKNLVTVILPEGMTSVTYRMFAYCSNLKNVRLPNTIKSIGGSAFYECNQLEEIDIPDSVKEIGDSAFSQCLSLKRVEIPSGMTSINYLSFNGCNALTSITIPSSVTSIGKWAFSHSDNLADVYVMSSDTSIVSDAFDDCSPSITIHSYFGSKAESYANSKNMGFVALDAPIISGYRINNAEKEVSVKEGTQMVLSGSVSAFEDRNISAIQVSVYDASVDVLGSVGEVYYHPTDLNAHTYDLSNVPVMIVGEAFGDSSYRMTAGNSYIVMLYAMDSDGHGFNDEDRNVNGYQGPSILVHVKEPAEECDHSSGNHNTTKNPDSVTRYRLNPEDESSHPNGHQTGDIYTRYCADCGSFLAGDILIWSNALQSHQMVDGTCSLCGYIAEETECQHIEYTDYYNEDYPVKYTQKDNTSHYYQLGYDRDCNNCDAVWQVYSDLSEDAVAPHDYTNGDVCPCGYDRSNCQHAPSEIKTYNRHLFKSLNEKQHKTTAIVWDVVCSTCGKTYEEIDTVGDENNTIGLPYDHVWKEGKCEVVGCEYECLHPEKQADGSDNYQDEYLGTVSLTDNGDGETHHHVYNVKRTCLLCEHIWTVTIDDPAERHTIKYLDKAGEYKHDENEHWLEVPEGCSCGYRTGKTENRNKEEHKPQVTSTDYRYVPDGNVHQVWRIQTIACDCGMSYEPESEYLGPSGHSDYDGDHSCDKCGETLDINNEHNEFDSQQPYKNMDVDQYTLIEEKARQLFRIYTNVDDLVDTFVEYVERAPFKERIILINSLDKILQLTMTKNVDRNTSYYQTLFNELLIDTDSFSDELPSEYVIFHELGHAVDDVAIDWYAGSVSTSYRNDDGRSLTYVIVNDVLEHIRKNVNATGYTDEEWENVLAFMISDDGNLNMEAKTIVEAFPTQWNFTLNEVMLAKEIIEFYSGPIRFGKEGLEFSDRSQGYLANSPALSDKFGGVTGNKLCGRYTHPDGNIVVGDGKNYWRTATGALNGMQAQELWADYYSYSLTNDVEGLRYIKEALPNAYSMLEDMKNYIYEMITEK